MTIYKDIVVFPKIAKSYAIKTDSSRNSLTGLGEWLIYGWHGYKLGTYYEYGHRGGSLYLASNTGSFCDFEESKKRVMNSLNSAVSFAWLVACQRLMQSNKRRASQGRRPLFDDIWMARGGHFIKKNGVRAFVGGAHEQAIFSLFDSNDKIIGCIDRSSAGIIGSKITDITPEVLIIQNQNESQEEMLKRFMHILRRK